MDTRLGLFIAGVKDDLQHIKELMAEKFKALDEKYDAVKTMPERVTRLEGSVRVQWWLLTLLVLLLLTAILDLAVRK